MRSQTVTVEKAEPTTVKNQTRILKKAPQQGHFWGFMMFPGLLDVGRVIKSDNRPPLKKRNGLGNTKLHTCITTVLNSNHTPRNETTYEEENLKMILQ